MSKSKPPVKRFFGVRVPLAGGELDDRCLPQHPRGREDLHHHRSKISRHSRVVPDHIDFRDIDCGKMSFGIAKNATTPSSIIKAAMAAIEIDELGRKQQST